MVANGPQPSWPFWAWLGVLAACQLFLPGLPNQVTVARAYLAAPALAYALHARTLPQLAGTVVVAAASDVLDGAVARRFKIHGSLGGALDPVVDGVFYGAVAVGLALGAAYPEWLAGVVVLRYVMPAVGGAVLLGMGARPELRHTFFGQVSTTVIAILLGGVALLRGLRVADQELVRVAEVAIPLATLATFANLALAALRSVERSRSGASPPR